MEHIESLKTPLDKFKFIIHNINVEENDIFSVDEERIDCFKGSPDFLLIKEKVKNLMLLMGEYNKKGKLEEFMHKDVEEEIWFMI